MLIFFSSLLAIACLLQLLESNFQLRTRPLCGVASARILLALGDDSPFSSSRGKARYRAALTSAVDWRPRARRSEVETQRPLPYKLWGRALLPFVSAARPRLEKNVVVGGGELALEHGRASEHSQKRPVRCTAVHRSK